MNNQNKNQNLKNHFFIANTPEFAKTTENFAAFAHLVAQTLCKH